MIRVLITDLSGVLPCPAREFTIGTLTELDGVHLTVTDVLNDAIVLESTPDTPTRSA